MRSKNAGPFTLTIDLMFKNERTFYKVLKSPSFDVKQIANLYCVPTVKIYPFKKVLAIKVVIPRSTPSGMPGDRDVYGSQQHFPLGNMDIRK